MLKKALKRPRDTALVSCISAVTRGTVKRNRNAHRQVQGHLLGYTFTEDWFARGKGLGSLSTTSSLFALPRPSLLLPRTLYFNMKVVERHKDRLQ